MKRTSELLSLPRSRSPAVGVVAVVVGAGPVWGAMLCSPPAAELPLPVLGMCLFLCPLGGKCTWGGFSWLGIGMHLTQWCLGRAMQRLLPHRAQEVDWFSSLKMEKTGLGSSGPGYVLLQLSI